MRTLALILGLGLSAKILVAIFLPLGVDEAYAIAVAREFSWSFFEHPPLAFWSPIVAAKITGLEHGFIYRLPFLIYGTLTTLVLYAMGRELGDKRAGLWAAALFTLTPFFMLSGGIFVVPDGPLYLGVTLAAFSLIRIVKHPSAPVRLWVYTGLGLAIAMASKYQAGLVPLGALLFIAATPRYRIWLRQSGPYIASVIGLSGLLPVVLWNIQHDWISLAFHTGRTGGFHFDNLMKMLAGQFLYLLPTTILALLGLRYALKSARTDAIRLLGVLALTPILLFNIIYLFSPSSFPHWTMPGWLLTLPLIGVWLGALTSNQYRTARRWVIGLAIPIWAIFAVALVHVNTGLITRFNHNTPPKWDNTLEVFSWSALHAALAEAGYLENIDQLAAPRWIEAGQMSTAMGGKWPMRVLDDAPHHFQFMLQPGGETLLLAPALLHKVETNTKTLLEMAQRTDPNARPLPAIILNRGGIPYIAVSVIRMQTVHK